MINITEAFIDYLKECKGKITPSVMDKAKACVNDYRAVVIAGARKNHDKWGSLEHTPEGSSVLWGYDKLTDSKTAALINGFNAHSLELDDGNRFAMIHLGACIISAIGAAKDEKSFSEDSFLKGIIIGYEAACRLSIAMQPSHKQRGYHTSGTCGTIGAAIGTAVALELSRIQMKRVISVAVGSAAGLLELQEQNSELKPYNIGRAAMDGITAAYMGSALFEPPEDALGGERGFFRMFSDDYSTEKLFEKTDYFEIERIYVKPYASCRHSHSAVEAAIELHDLIEPKSIDSVIVKTYKLGIKGHDHNSIEGPASAKLSTPYAVAVALLYGRADLSVFEPVDESASQLCARIHVEEDEELTKLSPGKRVAIVTVKTTDNRTLSRRVDYAKGDPENPMTVGEIKAKIDALADYRPYPKKEM